MTAKRLKPLDEHQRTLLSQWRADALERMPYFHPVLLNMAFFDAPGLGTMAVDAGLRCYIDFEVAQQRGAQWASDGLLHECGHIWNRHHDRAKQIGIGNDVRVSRDWNIAGDCAVNDDLIEAGCVSLATGEDPTPSMLGEPDHLTAEHYYGVIRSRRQQAGQQHCTSCGQQQPGSDPSDQQGQPGEGQCPGCGGAMPQFTGCGSVSGGQAAPCELPDDGGTFGQSASAYDDDEVEVMLVNAATAMVEQSTQKGRGSVPAAMLAQAELILAPPVVPWRDVLATSLRRCRQVAGRRKPTYRRRDRRKIGLRVDGREVIFPGRFDVKLSVMVVRDTSGSMSADDLNEVGSEVVGIAKSLGIKGDDLQVMDVDAVAYDPVPYRNVDSLREVHGRGGTDMRVGIERALGMTPRPDFVVVMTDGWTPWPDEQPPVPVVACLIGEGSVGTQENVPSWAITVSTAQKDAARRTRAA